MVLLERSRLDLGAKDWDDEAPIWDDLEEHWGHPRDFADDDDYSEGFEWSCCNERGDHEGCKSTKHKADINVIMQRPKCIPPAATKSNRKRKADQHIKMLMNKRKR
jgi:hypothetical protein